MSSRRIEDLLDKGASNLISLEITWGLEVICEFHLVHGPSMNLLASSGFLLLIHPFISMSLYLSSLSKRT